jgi:hypothetical protein
VLEPADHQAVLRLGELVLAPGPVAGKLGALQALPPDPVDLRPVRLDLFGRTDRHLQRGRRQCAEHLGGDMVVEESPAHLLAAWLAVGVVAPLAAVAVNPAAGQAGDEPQQVGQQPDRLGEQAAARADERQGGQG